MRYLVISAFGLALGYVEAGLAVVFGGMILLALGFIANDIERLTKAFKAQSEPQEDGTDDDKATLETLRRDVALVATQVRAAHHELATIRAGIARAAKGPWGD